jgi:hypothetical protein
MKRLRMSFFKWLSISALCVYFGFMIGKFKQDILQHKIQSLELDTTSLNAENTELIEKLAFIQSEKLSEQQILDGLESENKRLNEALDASNNKLYFYEKVVAPELAEEGLNVYSFTVTKATEKDTWLYELVLIQAQKGRSDLTGKIDITFTDSLESEAKTIKLSELDPNFSEDFKFEYFQTLKGSFTLPKTLKMEQIFLVVESSATRWKRAQRVEKIYDWKDFVENNKSSLEELATQAE